MNHPHPHADILIAIAEGKTIQVRFNCNDDWLDCSPLYFFERQSNRSSLDFRVKPKQQSGWFIIYYNKSTGEHYSAGGYKSKQEAIEISKNFQKVTAIKEINWTEGEGL